MPDSQGFATKDEIGKALGVSRLPGLERDLVASGEVRKIVACAGIVKIWASPGLGYEGASRLRSLVAALPGVEAVTVVPDEAGTGVPPKRPAGPATMS